MRWAIPLILLSLGACVVHGEHFDPRYHSFEVDGRTLDVRAQIDPLELGYFVRVSDRNGRLEMEDRMVVQSMIARDLSPLLCEGDAILHRRPGAILGFSAERERYLPDIGEWQYVVACHVPRT